MEQELTELAKRGFGPQLVYNAGKAWHVILILPQKYQAVCQGPVYHCESRKTPSEAVAVATLLVGKLRKREGI